MGSRPASPRLLRPALVAILVAGLTALTGLPAAQAAFDPRAPLSREVVAPGARDAGPRAIAHVVEVKLRLHRVGLSDFRMDGVYTPGTQAAVRQFQTRVGLRASGVVDRATWALLIRRTTHLAVPAVCRGAGWHMCYNRRFHEATLMRDGALYNSWLVRGGASFAPTRLGTHRVYLRDIDHVSSIYGSAMPYSQFFDGGEALHGSVLMTNPYSGHSHGCVNFYLEDARQLWNLTSRSRLVVTVHGAWS